MIVQARHSEVGGEPKVELFYVPNNGETIHVNSTGLVGAEAGEIEQRAMDQEDLDLVNAGKLLEAREKLLEQNPDDTEHWRIIKGIGYATVKVAGHPNGLIRAVDEFWVRKEKTQEN